MKLIVTTLDNVDVDKVLGALREQRIRATQVSSTGGFLRSGESTLLIGLDEGQVPFAMKIIADLASQRDTAVAYPHAGITPVTGFVDVPIGGFTSFVLDVDHFEQV
jgi:uncharacterized protein YaaQ